MWIPPNRPSIYKPLLLLSSAFLTAQLTGRDICCPSEQLILKSFMIWTSSDFRDGIYDLDMLWFQGWHLWSGHALILVASCFWCQQWDGETGRSPTKGTQINVCRSLNTSHRIWARHCEPINHCLHLYQQKTLDFPQFYIYRRGLIGRLNLIFY